MNAKVPFLCAALLAGSALFTPTFANAAVESPIVGYQNFEMEAGKWYQVGTPFVDLNDATDLTINDVFKSGFTDGDALNIYNPATGAYSSAKWKTSLNGWGKAIGNTPANNPLPQGSAVFIYKAVAGTVTVSGKVSESVATSVGSADGNAWGQIVCVYPSAAKVNDLKWTGFADGDTLSIFDPVSGAYTPLKWKSGPGGWGKAIGSTLSDYQLFPGQALFVNKVSPGVGTVSFQ